MNGVGLGYWPGPLLPLIHVPDSWKSFAGRLLPLRPIFPFSPLFHLPFSFIFCWGFYFYPDLLLPLPFFFFVLVILMYAI